MWRTLVIAPALAVLALQVCWAKSDPVVGSSDEAFAQARKQAHPETGDNLEEAIAQFFEPGGSVDEGTYPPSDVWSRGSLRRSPVPRVGYNGRTFFRYSSDDVSGVDKWEKDFELGLNYQDWDLFLRASDFNTFPRNHDPFRLEKLQLRYRQGDTKFTLGSLGALFGRGLALNMFDDRTVEWDNQAEGAKVETSLGNAEVTALWGTRKDRTSPRNTEMRAARVEVPVSDDLTVAANAVQVEFPHYSYTPETPNTLKYDLYGGDLTFRRGDFALFTEMVRLNRDKASFATDKWDGQGLEGKGYYANATFGRDGYALSAEYKDYQGLTQPFSVLPPLRHYSEQRTADPNDDKGYSAEFAWSPSDDGSQFAWTYAQGNSHERNFPYSEFSASYTSPARGKTTWVGEYWNVDVHLEKHNIQRLTVNRQLTSNWTASTFLERERLTANYYKAHIDYIVEGEVAYQSKLNLIYTWETTGADVTASQRSAWHLWELRLRPDERQEVNLGVGARRAGYVCAGGICRLEPEFSGWRIDYTFRF